MSASRVAVLAAVAAVLAWGSKAVAIGVAGGLDQSPLEGPLFVLGLVAIVVAFASLGAAVTRGRRPAARVIGALLGVMIGFALSILASSVAAAVVPDSAGWVQAEAGLWFSALLALAVTTLWRARRNVRYTAT
ncbi:hypothetical protein [Ornithinimicrobium sp. LYQ103]|uniref:hypothetical protein n=1 Tax=Ornithinimicrobium sp. LYQ103 TaxID=3378796 RepID=UPI0038527430